MFMVMYGPYGIIVFMVTRMVRLATCFVFFFLIKMVTLPIQLVICLIDSLGMLHRGHDHIHMAHTLIATEKEVEGFAQLLHRLVVPWLFRWPPPFISCVCCWLDMRELKQMNPTSFHRQRLSSAVEIDVETTSIISICQPMFGVIIMILTILTMTGWWFRTCFSIYWE